MAPYIVPMKPDISGGQRFLFDSCIFPDIGGIVFPEIRHIAGERYLGDTRAKADSGQHTPCRFLSIMPTAAPTLYGDSGRSDMGIFPTYFVPITDVPEIPGLSLFTVNTIGGVGF
jgi:hypothetical protein